MKRIKQDTFYQYQFLSNLNSNPSQTMACFVKSCVNEKDNSYQQDLFITDGVTTSLFMNDVKDYLFLDDEKMLVLDHIKTKKWAEKGYEYTVYKLVDIETKKTLKSIELPLSVGMIKVMDNGLLAILAKIGLDAPDYYAMTDKERRKVVQNRRANEDYQVMDEYPFFFNGQGFINKTRTSLFLCDLETLAIEKISTALMDVENVDIKDTQIVFSAHDFESYKTQFANVYSYECSTKELTTIYDKGYFAVRKVFFNEGRLLVAGTYGNDFGLMENSKLYTIWENTLHLFLDSNTSLHSSVGSDCRYGKTKNYLREDETSYFVTTSKGNAPVIKLVQDKFELVFEKEGSVDDFTFVNGKMMIIGMFSMKLQEVYFIEKDKLTQITTFNEKISSEYYIAKPNRFSVENEGYDIEGWYLLPFGYQADKQYPSVLDIHGGPKTAYGPVFYHEMQYWASLGYIVYFLNPRGSDGKGNDFADLKRKMGTIDYRDIMKYTDMIIKELPIDTENMAVTGGSYGGYMTNWIIGQTNRFKCAMSQRSISNWISMVAASDYGIDFPLEQQFDDVRYCHDELWNCSPLKYANNVTTPTLFIHSFEDYRCPLPEAYQLYTAIKCRGIDARICAFKGENHELSRSGKPTHRSRRLKEITDWLLKYTKEEN
ncbi:MAG: S9 family peptidase [Erysipelotrichaceae bacterium]